MNNASFTQNPFINGLKQISYDETYTTFQMEKAGQTAFYAGRTIRFTLNLVGAAADLALQICQIATSSFSLFIMQCEVKLKKCDPLDTKSKFLRVVPIAINEIREFATKNLTTYLSIDLEIITHYLKIQDHPKKVEDYIYSYLFI